MRTHSHRNCLFRALSEQLGDGHSNHKVVRRVVVAHMRDNKDHFAPFLEDDVQIDDYCELCVEVVMGPY